MEADVVGKKELVTARHTAEKESIYMKVDENFFGVREATGS